MAIVEEIGQGAGGSGYIWSSLDELLQSLVKLSKDLALPDTLVSGFMNEVDELGLEPYKIKSLQIVKEMVPKIKEVETDWGWEEVSTDNQIRILGNIIRLHGVDSWSSIEVCNSINDISPHLPSSLPLNLLPTLRPYFAPHPSLSSASRPLKTTTGGKDVNMDMHEIQPFKSAAGWGSHNILRWCASRLTADEVEKNLGLVLPPTLVMMDDYEPSWRETGATVLESWTFKLDPAVLHRMGLDALLLKSLIHTLSLHPNPPVYKVLPITLHLIEYTNPPGRERTELYGNIMEKHFVQGWVYAPSGIEGKVVSIGLAEELIIMCDLLGPAIVRWLKSIISHLLDPIQYPPTPPIIPHYKSNLTALLHLIRTIRATGRLARWRGQVLDILSRLWVQCQERKGIEDTEEEAMLKPLEELVKELFKEIALQIPSVIEVEYPQLLSLSTTMFKDLIAAST
ncbi:hypothetical protein J010_05704 [Cryptococcus neoformans]|nr:hypothetical protein C355_05648 [Cryptococcus neoformans var. grubii Th84]OXH03337.1 hypothetical protein J010_05704 [Cryptococcus neoformans var. grubii]OXH25220.1 hypothetical protein J009_05694 [Cryptococcus neoformans var. grubii]OXH45056.1 hypothetical protein J004_05743 [Cryptococcus neoformans var. grubii]OXH45948.1 hypothetical protein J003_05642 [Cryptococcus neoformans var. grubii]